MKLRSFRLRIALLSALLAGSALAGFSGFSWLLIYKTKLARLDSEIKTQLLQKAWVSPKQTNWQSYEKNLVSVFTKASQMPIGVLVIDRQGEIIYKSRHWPASLEPTNLWPVEETANTGPPQPLTLPLQGQPPFPLEQGQPPFPPPQGQPPFPPPQGQPPFPPPQGQPPFPPPHRLPPFPPPQGQPASQTTNQVPMGAGDGVALSVKLMTRQNRTAAWRVGVVMPPHPRIAIAVSFEGIDWEMSAIRNGFLISVPVVLVGVALGAWLVSGSALHPVHQVIATIRQISATGLNQRISINAADVEFLELLQVFNQMMERLERSFKQASRFSADAAHELKTPLAILQGELERTLQKAEPASEQQQNLSNLLDEVSRLREIVRKLLLLSQADAGQMRLHQIEINLSELLTHLLEDVEMLAPDLPVFSKIEPALLVQGDRDLLIQVLHNLITNGIKYNLPQGWLKIEAICKNNTIFVTVSNSSRDIPAADREKIFERFYRGDPSRTRQIEGLGLGLSLSREIARAHAGDLKLNHTPPGETAFTLKLPAIVVPLPTSFVS